MTLFKQLFLGASIAFLLAFGATEMIYVRNAHTYLQEQLASHAQDAATSLGMVLPEAMAAKDMVRAEVTVNALFDRGYYQTIRVVNIQGETVVLKTLTGGTANVPQWFTKALPIEAPSAESLISKGWSQLGRVVVSSHPNFAYKQLWRTLLEYTLGLTLLYLLAMVALHSFLRRILKPLQAIEDVAHAIGGRDFQTIQPIPRTRELRNVVNAINSMSYKLREVIEHEVRQAIRFRDESSRDVLTGLDNQRGLEIYVNAMLEGGMNLSSGAMFMLKIIDFHGYNTRHGFQQGDALLKEIANALRGVYPDRDFLRSRLNGATFAAVVPNISREEAAQMGAAFSAAMNSVINKNRDDSPISFGCGAVYFTGQSVSLPALNAQCDMATQQSLSNGKSQCVLLDLADADQSKGLQYWKNLIMDAISSQRVTLFSQPVKKIGKEERLQVEVLGRLTNEDGKLVPAEQFIPMANRHLLTPALDLAILKRLFNLMSNGTITDDEVAINLSVYSIHDPELLDWLISSMRADAALAKRLVFELTEFGVVQDRPGVENFVTAIRKLGADFGVDNFGLHHSAFEYLQQLMPRYVKLCPVYSRDLWGNLNHQFFISSVVKIARPLEISVIALAIEDIGMLTLLDQLGVDGYQGYVTGNISEYG